MLHFNIWILYQCDVVYQPLFLLIRCAREPCKYGILPSVSNNLAAEITSVDIQNFGI